MANHLDLEEQEQLDQLKHFWNTWGTLISFLVIAVAGSLLAWNGYQYWQNRQANQAAALFEAIEVASRSGDQPRMEQAFADIKAKYASTTQASQAGLALAKSLADAGNAAGAKDALAWVTAQSKDEGLKALARLRLASVLMDEKSYVEALQLLSGATLSSLKAFLRIAVATFIYCKTTGARRLPNTQRHTSPGKKTLSTVVLCK